MYNLVSVYSSETASDELYDEHGRHNVNEIIINDSRLASELKRWPTISVKHSLTHSLTHSKPHYVHQLIRDHNANLKKVLNASLKNNNIVWSDKMAGKY